ncbi:MAG: type II secretion system F family protein [Acidobacteria bacterium]|nr:MAG: type II secretion system F family protein [Acidobacteriota bacterium]
MPKFKYKAFDESGTFVEDVATFPTQEALIVELQNRGFNIVQIERIDKEEEKAPRFQIPFGGVSDRDLSIFCRQLGTMINAGLPLIDALGVIAEQLPNKKLASSAWEVARMVSEGVPVSTAMSKFPKLYPEFVVNLVRVGEETGNLDTALIRAADYYEKIAMIKSKIKSAAFYPTFVIIIATLIVTGILYFLVPTFGEIYASLGGELPLPTQMLIGASNVLRQNLLLIIAFVVFAAVLFKVLMVQSYNFRKGVHSFMLKAPKMGDLVIKSTMAKFARTMATLFSSGVTLERAFEIAGQVTGNVPIKEALESAKKAVIEGEAMHKALEKTGMFPKLILSMIRVGEDTGRLDEMLDTVARFYEDEFDKAVEGMIKLIEPALIVFIGGIVGLILIALYMPIFKLGELIK